MIHLLYIFTAGLFVYAIWKIINRSGRRDSDTVSLPKNSHIESPASSRLIRCLRKIVQSGCSKILVDVGKVEEFPFETYLVLCAQAEKAADNNKTVLLSSSSPLSPNARRTLMASMPDAKTHHQHLIGEETVFTQQSRITPQVIETLGKELRRIGIKDYYELNTLVTEIIGNALEHGIRDQNINWWMYHYIEKGAMKMVFVDMGIGIASSYRKAGFGFMQPNRRLVKKAIKGEAGSSTKEANRGRGLKQINFMVENKFISDFILITNSVTLRYINGGYTSTRHSNFVGTYYSWTVNKENFRQWQTWLTSQTNTAKH